MSYSQPRILKDTAGHSGQLEATQNINDEFSKIAKDLTTEETKINDTVKPQNEPFVKPVSTLTPPPTPTSKTVPGAGTEVAVDPSQSTFYKGNNPINNSGFYQNTENVKTLFAPTDPNPPTLQELRDDWADREREATKPGADLNNSLKLL